MMKKLTASFVVAGLATIIGGILPVGTTSAAEIKPTVAPHIEIKPTVAPIIAPIVAPVVAPQDVVHPELTDVVHPENIIHPEVSVGQ